MATWSAAGSMVGGRRHGRRPATWPMLTAVEQSNPKSQCCDEPVHGMYRTGDSGAQAQLPTPVCMRFSLFVTPILRQMLSYVL